MRIIFTSSTWIDGVRSLERLIRLSAKLLATLVSHSATISSAPSLIRTSGVSRSPPSTTETIRIQQLHRRVELADDAQRCDQPRRHRHQPDDEGVADNRGGQPDDQPGQRQLGRHHEHVAAARPGRVVHDDARSDQHDREYRGGCGGDQHAGEVTQGQRPAHRERSHVDTRADGGIDRIGDAGGGQHQAELQIEPGRGELRADRTRGGVQELDDVFQSGPSAKSRSRPDGVRAHQAKLIRSAGRFPQWRLQMPSIQHARRCELGRKTGHIVAFGRNGLASNCGDDKDAIASICSILRRAPRYGFSRFSQPDDHARCGSGDGRNPVEPAGAALRRPAAAGIPADRHAGGRCRARPAALRRCAQRPIWWARWRWR